MMSAILTSNHCHYIVMWLYQYLPWLFAYSLQQTFHWGFWAFTTLFYCMTKFQPNVEYSVVTELTVNSSVYPYTKNHHPTPLSTALDSIYETCFCWNAVWFSPNMTLCTEGIGPEVLRFVQMQLCECRLCFQPSDRRRFLLATLPNKTYLLSFLSNCAFTDFNIYKFTGACRLEKCSFLYFCVCCTPEETFCSLSSCGQSFGSIFFNPF